MKISTITVLAALVLSGITTTIIKIRSSHNPPVPFAPRYTYHSREFESMVERSFVITNSGDPKQFFDFMDAGLKQREGKDWNTVLAERKSKLDSISDTDARTNEELANAIWLHKTIKGIIRKFSLDRGFEFAYTTRLGERQCFLQSTLMSSYFQTMGMNAGVEMVYINPTGGQSNNGHAVTLLRLSNGKDIVVDCSEPSPFPQHQGLFVYSTYDKTFHFVNPVYELNTGQITAYKRADGKDTLPVDQVEVLFIPYLLGNFYYYRGERAVDGHTYSKPTTEGLKTEMQMLEISVRFCSENPLAVYMLGRTYTKLNMPDKALNKLNQARELYVKYGWLPSSIDEAIKEARDLKDHPVTAALKK